MSSTEERLARLEAQQEQNTSNQKEVWDAITDIREKLDKGRNELQIYTNTQVAEVCKKLVSCETRCGQNFKNIREGVENQMMVEIEAMKDTIDKVWGLTWKALSLLAVIIMTMVGWNITLMTRMSSAEGTIAQLRATTEIRQEVDKELLRTLQKMDDKLTILERR